MKESTLTAAVPGSFDLAGSRTPELQRYTTETRVMMHAPDGSITATDVYKLFLLCTPSAIAGTAGDRYTCEGFTVHPEQHRRAGLRQWLDNTLRPWFDAREDHQRDQRASAQPTTRSQY